MSEVCIAVPRRLGSRRETSINEMSTLPLSNDVATVRQSFNDNTASTLIRTVNIKDAKERNENYIEQELLIENRDLVGKKSSVAPVFQHDMTKIKAFHHATLNKAYLEEVEYYKTMNYNMVAFPFTTAEPLDFSYRMPNGRTDS